jgi:hypothetical protein
MHAMSDQNRYERLFRMHQRRAFLREPVCEGFVALLAAGVVACIAIIQAAL